VEPVLFRRKLFDSGVNRNLNLHLRARDIIQKELTVFETCELAKALRDLPLPPARIDLGRLGAEWLEARADLSAGDFLRDRLHHLLADADWEPTPRDVVLYGFGRIGRLLARSLAASMGKGQQLRLRAIVTRGYREGDIEKRAELLRNDSVHGSFRGTVEADEQGRKLYLNGLPIEMISANKPTEIDYTQYGIVNALVIDNTGAWRDRDGLSQHLDSKGVANVLLTAPGKGDLPNIVYGINHREADVAGRIFTAASCTTNAIVPPLKVLEDNFGIEVGHIETVHSYTNDQNLIDNHHKKYRRGRAATLNLVITETGAGKAVAKALPGLEGKLTGNAVRVPTPNGSLAILNLTLKRETTREELNGVLKHYALHSELVEQLEFSDNYELVSSDIIGNPHAGIVDGAATIVGPTGRTAVVYVWYDNEYGYCEQVLRLAKHVAGVRRYTYY
jgi:glyceraldehyde 3-phosphate dehydrogenase